MNTITRLTFNTARVAPSFSRTFSTSLISRQARQDGSPNKPFDRIKWEDINKKRGRKVGGEGLDALQEGTDKLSEIKDYKPVVEIDPSFYPRLEPGLTYDPFDFSIKKIKLDRQARLGSKTNKLEGDPLKLWKNTDILAEFVNSNGMIIQGSVSGLPPKTQKKLSKAIRRARAAGLMPYFHKPVFNSIN